MNIKRALYVVLSGLALGFASLGELGYTTAATGASAPKQSASVVAAPDTLIAGALSGGVVMKT